MIGGPTRPGGRVVAWLYGLGVAVALFSGMGQMPILKRYYVSDLPLMGWSADFYVLSNLHYLAVALLLGLYAWRLSVGTRLGPVRWGWGPGSWWGWTLLAVLLVSGVVKVLRNLGVYVYPPLMVVVDLCHLGAAMAFMVTGLVVLFGGRAGTSKERILT